MPDKTIDSDAGEFREASDAESQADFVVTFVLFLREAEADHACTSCPGQWNNEGVVSVNGQRRLSGRFRAVRHCGGDLTKANRQEKNAAVICSDVHSYHVSKTIS